MNLWFWGFMLAMSLLIPAAMVIFGKRLMAAPPKKINGTFGYRTARSMQNEDTWRYAHHCLGRLWTRLGAALLCATAVAMPFSLARDIGFMGLYGLAVVTAQLVFMIFPVFMVEGRLKKTFDANGNRK